MPPLMYSVIVQDGTYPDTRRGHRWCGAGSFRLLVGRNENSGEKALTEE